MPGDMDMTASCILGMEYNGSATLPISAEMNIKYEIFLVSIGILFVVPSISVASVTPFADATATATTRLFDVTMDSGSLKGLLCWAWSENKTLTSFNLNGKEMMLQTSSSVGYNERQNFWYATTTDTGQIPLTITGESGFRSFGVCASIINVNLTLKNQTSTFITPSNPYSYQVTSTLSNSLPFLGLRSGTGGAEAASGTIELYDAPDFTTLVTATTTVNIGDYITFNYTDGNGAVSMFVNVPGAEAEEQGSETATAYLKYPPANTSSTPIPDWTGNWPTRILNPVPFRTYYEHVRYALVSSTNPYPGIGNLTHEDAVSFVSNTSSSENWPIIKTNILSNFPGIINENGVFEWELLYEFGTDPTFTTVLSSSTKHFFVNYFAPDPNTSSSQEAGIMTSTSTWIGISNDLNRRYGFTIAGCSVNATATYSVWSPGDWKCMFIGTMQELASTTASYGAQAVGSAISTVFSNLFPTNIFVTFTGKINEISNPSGIDPTIYFPNPIHPTSTGVILLSSSTPGWIKEQTGWDFETVVSYLIYLFTGYLVYVSARKAAFMADKNEAHA